jgi:hypothetical protein
MLIIKRFPATTATTFRTAAFGASAKRVCSSHSVKSQHGTGENELMSHQGDQIAVVGSTTPSKFTFWLVHSNWWDTL